MISSHDDRSLARFPLWLELSGLPLSLNTAGKCPFVWTVFRKIVELDIAVHPRLPGIVEITPVDLAMRCGIEATKLPKAVKGLRKGGVVRAFLPEEESEEGLFQVITPIPTPVSCEDVRRRHPALFLETPWPPRYAVEITDTDQETDDNKIKKVADLYLDVFSMKLNPLILDQLQMIADHYEFALIRKVFDRAAREKTRSLGWIITEMRRETLTRARIEERKRREEEERAGESSGGLQ